MLSEKPPLLFLEEINDQVYVQIDIQLQPQDQAKQTRRIKFKMFEMLLFTTHKREKNMWKEITHCKETLRRQAYQRSRSWGIYPEAFLKANVMDFVTAELYSSVLRLFQNHCSWFNL